MSTYHEDGFLLISALQCVKCGRILKTDKVAFEHRKRCKVAPSQVKGQISLLDYDTKQEGIRGEVLISNPAPLHPNCKHTTKEMEVSK